MGMLQEFKDFAIKGNVIDMGVGIVIGAAFTTIVNSFVKDIINPILGLFTGGIDFSNIFLPLNGQSYASLKAAQDAGAATINIGLFINAIISFVIVAWILFMVIKATNKLKKSAPPPPAPAVTPEDVLLLREIRDSLARR